MSSGRLIVGVSVVASSILVRSILKSESCMAYSFQQQQQQLEKFMVSKLIIIAVVEKLLVNYENAIQSFLSSGKRNYLGCHCLR